MGRLFKLRIYWVGAGGQARMGTDGRWNYFGDLLVVHHRVGDDV